MRHAQDEEDVDEGAYDAIRPRAAALREEMRRHLADGNRGEVIRSGIRVAIVGPPNAGKSTLLNLLARRPAAIVSPIPGTTRWVGWREGGVDGGMWVGGCNNRLTD